MGRSDCKWSIWRGRKQIQFLKGEKVVTEQTKRIEGQNAAVDEIRRILTRDIILLGDTPDEEVTPQILERVVLFEGIISSLNLFDEQVGAATLLATRVLNDCRADSIAYKMAYSCLLLTLGEADAIILEAAISTDKRVNL